MRTNVEAREVTSNVGERKAFSIKANGKAFRALISGLYANKPQSITREIWSNALDAHAMAGNTDRPFEVSFPTVFDPSFRVRDYGISLTHDQVMDMYTTLFESTKEDTNEQVGKLGLGSKSPFSYTDSFSVTVVMDGEKRFYAAMIGEDDVPTIAFMGEEETDEDNGVEVAFPVDKKDVPSFALAAKRVSHGFDVKPTVMNDAAGFSGWPTMTPVMEGDGWKILSAALEGYRSQAYAKMGCVLYPINTSALQDLTTEEREVLNHPMVIDFEIGDLEITVSREELSYGRNEPTIGAILMKVRTIVEELRAAAAAHFAGCTTYWEACVLYHTTATDHRLPEFLREMYKKYGTWNGQKCVNKFSIKFPFTTEAMVFDSKRFSRVGVTFRKGDHAVDFTPQKNTVFLFEDLTAGRKVKRSTARVRAWKESTTSKQAVWVKFYDRVEMQKFIIQIMERFDGAYFIDIESIDPPSIARNGAGERRPVMPRMFDGNGFNDLIDMDEDDFEEGGLYIPLERMNPVVPAGARSPEVVIRALVNVGAITHDTPVFGVPKSLRKCFEGDHWVNLYDYANEWLAENVTDIDAKRRHRDAVATVQRDALLGYLNNTVAVSELEPDSVVLDALSLYKMAQDEKVTNTAPIYDLASYLGRAVEESEPEEDLLLTMRAEVTERLGKAYPLLETLQDNVSVHNKEISLLLTQYVIMCDTMNRMNHIAQFQIAAE